MQMESILFKTIYLKENQGHGNARRKSLSECTNSLVALMDSDDLCMEDRFEKQLHAFVRNNNLSVVGGLISEFEDIPSNTKGIRFVPKNNDEIRQFMKNRCPMNQVTVMFRKEDVEKSGGYQDWYCEEDYFLWLRMFEKGFLFENIQEVLVNVRVGEDMASRRGGWKYFLSESKLQKYMLQKDIICFPRFLYNIAIRFFGEVVIGSKLRKRLYSFLRSDATIICSNNKQIAHMDEVQVKYPSFSVSMCVYGGDNADWFDMALQSVVKQTVKPAEIVLVIDGPISEQIQEVINKYKRICKGQIFI